ncbi:MAG: CrcB family protein [Actinomycetia bacterium]|nr:CrcB family protein [Actinomycetes bacterium]
MTALLIAIGGGLGAVARFGIASMIPRTRLGFPSGITIVNIAGSFLLGLVVGIVEANEVAIATEPLTLGLLGGFTTFSTWMVDIDEAPTRRMAVAIVAIPLVAGLVAAAAGLWLGAFL